MYTYWQTQRGVCSTSPVPKITCQGWLADLTVGSASPFLQLYQRVQQWQEELTQVARPDRHAKTLCGFRVDSTASGRWPFLQKQAKGGYLCYNSIEWPFDLLSAADPFRSARNQVSVSHNTVKCSVLRSVWHNRADEWASVCITPVILEVMAGYGWSLYVISDIIWKYQDYMRLSRTAPRLKADLK